MTLAIDYVARGRSCVTYLQLEPNRFPSNYIEYTTGAVPYTYSIRDIDTSPVEYTESVPAIADNETSLCCTDATGNTDVPTGQNLVGRESAIEYDDPKSLADLECLWRGKLDIAEPRFERRMHIDPMDVFRWALCGAMRMMFMGQLGTFAEDVTSRFGKAEMLCRIRADKLALGIQSYITDAPSRKLGRTKTNPGQLAPNFAGGTQREWDMLRDWRSLIGTGALCAWFTAAIYSIAGLHTRSYLAIQRAQTIVRRGFASKHALESPSPNCNLYLVYCLLDILPLRGARKNSAAATQTHPLGIVSYTYRYVRGSLSEHITHTDADRQAIRRRLEHFLKQSRVACTTESEAIHISQLVLIYIDLVDVTSIPWDSRSVRTLEAAKQTVCEILARNQDYVLYRWLLSHIQRRLGDVAAAIESANALKDYMDQHMICSDANVEVSAVFTPQRRRSLSVRAKSFFGRPGTQSSFDSLDDLIAMPASSPRNTSDRRVRFGQPRYGFVYDTALCYFVARVWGPCEQMLRPLVDSGARFNRRLSSTILLAACAGARWDVHTSVYWLERLCDIARNESTENDTESGWAIRAPTLVLRPHKELLQFELAYFLGILQWVGGNPPRNTEWLQRTCSELARIDSEVTINVLFPDELVSSEAAAEELITAVFLRAAAFCAIGDYANAESLFRAVIVNASTERMKHATKSDPWHIPFAQYELACIEVHRGRFLAADTFFAQVHAAVQKPHFSFAGMLSDRLACAREYADRVAPVRLAVTLT